MVEFIFLECYYACVCSLVFPAYYWLNKIEIVQNCLNCFNVRDFALYLFVFVSSQLSLDQEEQDTIITMRFAIRHQLTASLLVEVPSR